jgi:hypothetical protein
MLVDIDVFVSMCPPLSPLENRANFPRLSAPEGGRATSVRQKGAETASCGAITNSPRVRRGVFVISEQSRRSPLCAVCWMGIGSVGLALVADVMAIFSPRSWKFLR